MRTARLLAMIVTILGVGLLAPPAGAQPPVQLPNYVTDDVGALSNSGRAAVKSAVDKLYADRHIRLWVVYVDDFSGQSPQSWARSTWSINNLGEYDALLAVATVGRAYDFLVPSAVKSVSSTKVDELRRDKIEPALHNGDWSGAAIAAASGLDTSPHSTSPATLLVALGVIAVTGLLLMFFLRHRARRRRAAAIAAARRIDPTDANALAAVSLDALDDLSRSKVVDVDNALRTSSNELDVAISEFGDERTRPFTQAVTNAKAALAQAFTVRQQLDDADPETPEERRDLLTRVIVSAARADRELESQREAFEKMRDLVIDASARLDSLTQQYVELTSRLDPSAQRLTDLHNDFDPAALATVSGNVTAATERLEFADRSIAAAREVAGKAVTGQQSVLVDTYRSAEAALGQARALLDAVDHAASDIRHAIAEMPAAIVDARAGIDRADGLLTQPQTTKYAHGGELRAARDAVARAVEYAGVGSADPLGAFGQLTKADADLDRLLASIAEEQANEERLHRSYQQALFTADARVRGVSDYIDTRRGVIGPEARTRIAEATRHLQAARDKGATNVTEAIAHANAASKLAAQAQSLANDDARSAQRAYAGRQGGGNMGAMVGGIIIGDLLSGGMGGGSGNWSPTSYGGSAGGSDGGFDGGLGGGFDGDFMGGGGRF
jgi:hypothetical protein